MDRLSRRLILAAITPLIVLIDTPALGTEAFLNLELGGALFQLSNSSQNETTITAGPVGGAAKLGLELKFNGRTALLLEGGAIAAPVKAAPGTTSTDSPFMHAFSNLGLQFDRGSLRYSLLGGISYLPVLESASVGVVTLPTTLAPHGIFDLGWRFLQGPSHDLWLHVHLGYLYGLQSSATQTFDHGIKYGAELNFNLIEGGTPLGVFARSENELLLTTGGTQRTTRFIFGFRIFTRLANPKTSRGRKYLTTGD